MCYRRSTVESGAFALITIHHAKGTRSVRPLWLCFELDLEVAVETVPFNPDHLASPAWRALSPAGKIPLMVDGDLVIFESGAIVEHILDRYGDGRLRPPPATAERALYLQWSWFAEATLIRPLGVGRLLSLTREPPEALRATTLEKTREALAAVDQALADGRAFLLGADFTAADVMMGYSLALLESHRLVDAGAPHALAYLQRLKGREAFQRAATA